MLILTSHSKSRLRVQGPRRGESAGSQSFAVEEAGSTKEPTLYTAKVQADFVVTLGGFWYGSDKEDMQGYDKLHLLVGQKSDTFRLQAGMLIKPTWTENAKCDVRVHDATRISEPGLG